MATSGDSFPPPLPSTPQDAASPPANDKEGEAAAVNEERQPAQNGEREEGVNQNLPTPFQRLAIGGAGAANKPPTLLSKVTQSVLLTPLHPVRFVHVLIQLGHEPVPPERGFSILWQRYQYYWPGIIGYARAVAQKDGWMELYRGVGGHLACDIANHVASYLLNPIVKKIVGAIPLSVVASGEDTPDNEDNVETTRAILVRGVHMFFHQLMLRSAVTVLVQPFYVVSVRMIAQHVGKEGVYNWVPGSFVEVYRREGLAGFFKGMVPALLGGVLATVMQVTLWVGLELLAKQVTQEMGKTMIRNIIRPFLISYIPRSYAYPFELMRVVMAANDSGLALGMEPHVPKFHSWIDSYRYLKSQHVMYRGSVFFLPRYAYSDPK